MELLAHKTISVIINTQTGGKQSYQDQVYGTSGLYYE